MRRDILNVIKINDLHTKLRTAKAYLAAHPRIDLFITRALTKLAHQFPTYDASSA